MADNQFDLLNLFVNRFSVRSYMSKKVESEKISFLLEAARWAPTAGNLQELKYILVEKEEIKNKLIDACYKQSWMATAPLYIVIVSDTSKLKKFYGSRGETVYSIADGAIAAENIMLEAAFLGLGSCYVGAFYEDQLNRILEIPNDEKVIAIVTVGYPFNAYRETDRTNIDGKVFFNKYGVKFENPNFIKGNYRIGEVISDFLKKIKNIKINKK